MLTAVCGANLREADLSGATLRGVDLRGADLRGANLQNAELSAADLKNANFENADLSHAKLLPAQLTKLEPKGESLGNISNSRWERSILGTSINMDKSSEVFLLADLTGSNLRHANLRYADLRHANLNEADLRNANLSGTNLGGAMIRNREALVRDELSHPPHPGNLVQTEQVDQAASLEGATMPSGQEY
jgi:uncharacterized protein YjbI with pentapeptide repeats